LFSEFVEGAFVAYTGGSLADVHPFADLSEREIEGSPLKNLLILIRELGQLRTNPEHLGVAAPGGFDLIVVFRGDC
jgi:hypothetical protein